MKKRLERAGALALYMAIPFTIITIITLLAAKTQGDRWGTIGITVIICLIPVVAVLLKNPNQN